MRRIWSKKIREGVNGVEKPLSGLKIIVDAGNGGAGFFTDKVLKPLGADTAGSQFLDPDGTFPNHPPNPEDKSAEEAAIKAVKNSKADLGIIFDTDVDRSGLVDQSGQAVTRNRLIALLSTIVSREFPGSTIVTDSVTSDGLREFIENRGLKHLRFRRGYKNVINKGVELNDEGVDCQLMIETSGHGAMKENFFLDDGAYLAAKALIEVGRMNQEGKGDNVGDLLKDLKEPESATEIRLKLVKGGVEAGKAILEKFEKALKEGREFPEWELEKVNYEGVRANIVRPTKGWILVRSSLHDPLLVMNAELEGPEKELERQLAVLHVWLDQNSDGALDLSVLPSKDKA